MPDTKPLVGILLLFSPIVTIGFGVALGSYPFFTVLGLLSIFSIFGVIYPAAGYFISAYIKLKFPLQKINLLFFTIFIGLGLLNIYLISTSWSYGLRYQGKLITYGFSIISIACHIYFFFVIKKIFATQPLENHWKAHGLFWFWLSALAFPLFGEIS
jgi:hypothetical protein